MTEPIECAACSSRSVFAVERWPAGKRARAMACRDCGLLFLHASSRRDTVNDPHRIDVAESIWSLNESSTAATKKTAALALMTAVDGDVASLPATRRVLGVGSGAGVWLDTFRDRGWETFGIGRADRVAGTRHSLLSDLPVDSRFDLVIAYRMLERAPRPLDALHALARTIKEGGHCFVSVPRLDTLAAHRDVRYCLRAGKHASAFTESCLRGLLARAGLDVVSTLGALDRGSAQGESNSLVLRVLARKVDAVTPVRNPAAALEPVLQALETLDSGPIPAAMGSTAPVPSACPACEGANVQLVDEWYLPGNQARAAMCDDCGLLFVHPLPSQEALDAYYARDGAWYSSRANRQVGAEGLKTGAAGAVTVILPALDRFLPATKPIAGARVFDFGCGAGAWLDAFQDRGWDTYGLEPSTDAPFQRHKRLLTVPPQPQFDLVIAYHVLEHLPRPLGAVRELAGALVEGGHLLVSVPRLDTLAVHRQVDYCLHPRHHIVGYTEACLRGLLARAGLEVVESFHMLDSSRSKGLPVRLQLLARKTATPPAVESDVAAALQPVIAAFIALKAPARSSVPRSHAANQ